MSKLFGVRKFRQLLLASSFAVAANYVVRLADALIVGNMIGSDALAGVNLAAPVLSCITFLSGLIAIGVGTKYSLEMGRCDLRRAREYFMQGVWSVTILGGVLGLLILVGHGWLVTVFGATSEIAVLANDYLGWIWPSALLEGYVMLLVALAYADGDTRLASISYIALFVGNLLFSVLAVKLGLGCAGCALGTVIAEALAIAILALHFLRKTNTMKYVWHFSWLDTLLICGASFGDAAAFLCDGLLFLFINAFLVHQFGTEMLPVAGVVISIWGLLTIFDGLGVAIQPVVTVYYGEGNFKSVRAVMKAAMHDAFVEGLAMTLLLDIFAGPVVCAFGISSSDPLYASSVAAVRMTSIGFVAYALASLFNSYYMFIERSFLAGTLTFATYLLLPIVTISCGSLIGGNGMWIGLGCGTILGLVCSAAFIIPLSAMSAFPLLLPKKDEDKVFVYDLSLTDSEITEVSRQIGELPGVPMRAALIAEEVFEVVKDRNAGRRVLGEVTVDLTNGVTMTLRDDGEIFDITDSNAEISSLRTFLVASVMESHAGKMNLVTTGFNRNVFRF